MLPIIGLAVSLFPELVTLIAGDKAGKVAGDISDAVKTVTGTADPGAAQKRVSEDPHVEMELKARLAAIAIEARKLQIAEADAKRRDELEALKASLVDTQDARDKLEKLAEGRSPIAWAAPVVSVIVAAGFFVIIALAFVFPDRLENNNAAYALIGTMATAFATMISFWLGSSQGSRDKDQTMRQMQQINSQQASGLMKLHGNAAQSALPPVMGVDAIRPVMAPIAQVVPMPPRATVAPAAQHVSGAGTDDVLESALAAVAPKLDTGIWLPALSNAFEKYGLASDKRKAAAVGQFLVEAGASFHDLEENLFYTHVEAIMRAFGGHFQSQDEAAAYLRNPERLANKIYANRLGNGDEASGDGYKYRGRGLIQLTGRSTYAEFAKSQDMTVEQAAEYCRTPEGAAMSGCWYLLSRNALSCADTWDLTTLTKLVNGKAMLALNDRVAYANAMLRALSNTLPAAA